MLARDATLVLSGRIISVGVVARPQMALNRPNLRVQLVEVVVHVERVLSGQMQNPEVAVRFYRDANDGEPYVGPPRGNPIVGRRGIFLLRAEGDRARCIIDITPCWINLIGATSETRQRRSTSVLEAIAETLLEPPQEIESRVTFAAQLDEIAALAIRYAGKLRALCLLRSLLRSEAGEIKTQTCAAISSHFYYHDKCAEEARERRDSALRVHLYVATVLDKYGGKGIRVLFGDSIEDVRSGYWILKSHRSALVRHALAGAAKSIPPDVRSGPPPYGAECGLDPSTN